MVYKYAPKLMLDYLTAQMPGVFFCTKFPANMEGPPVSGRPCVQISTIPAGQHPNPFMAYRGLVFACVADTEYAAGLVAEDVRHYVFWARFAHVVRKTEIIGEPARFDLDDEPVPRIQLSARVTMREHYPR